MALEAASGGGRTTLGEEQDPYENYRRRLRDANVGLSS